MVVYCVISTLGRCWQQPSLYLVSSVSVRDHVSRNRWMALKECHLFWFSGLHMCVRDICTHMMLGGDPAKNWGMSSSLFPLTDPIASSCTVSGKVLGLFLLFFQLVIKPRVACIWGTHSTTELQPQALALPLVELSVKKTQDMVLLLRGHGLAEVLFCGASKSLKRKL